MKANSLRDIVLLATAGILGLVLAVGAYALMRPQAQAPQEELVLERPEGQVSDAQEPAEEEDFSTELNESILHEMTFTAQAPFGEWSDPRLQDGCEEAASLMAVFWARGETFTLEEAKAEILAASEYELATYGSYHDTSAADTLSRIIEGYFGFDGARLARSITKQEMIDELYAGNVLIIPTNGRALNNPNFTAGGPERHMLVVKGYDVATDEFITNDNGTRQGEGYRYDANVLFGAIRDYTSGYHEPIVGTSKVMIVVEPEQGPSSFSRIGTGAPRKRRFGLTPL